MFLLQLIALLFAVLLRSSSAQCVADQTVTTGSSRIQTLTHTKWSGTTVQSRRCMRVSGSRLVMGVCDRFAYVYHQPGFSGMSFQAGTGIVVNTNGYLQQPTTVGQQASIGSVRSSARYAAIEGSGGCFGTVDVFTATTTSTGMCLGATSATGSVQWLSCNKWSPLGSSNVLDLRWRVDNTNFAYVSDSSFGSPGSNWGVKGGNPVPAPTVRSSWGSTPTAPTSSWGSWTARNSWGAQQEEAQQDQAVGNAGLIEPAHSAQPSYNTYIVGALLAGAVTNLAIAAVVCCKSRQIKA